MQLFWKILGTILAFDAMTIGISSYWTSTWYLREAEDRLAEQHRAIGAFVSKEIEKGYVEGQLPFQSLARLTEERDILFWWVVREDSVIHLANEAPFMETRATDYFPQVAYAAGEEKLVVNRDEHYGLLIEPITMGGKEWSFWLGFSARALSKLHRRVLFLGIAAPTLAVLVLGLALYVIVMYFLRPINDLMAGATEIGKGNLTHRIEISSRDELGHLAGAFNKMVADLQKTTVSRAELARANRRLAREIGDKNDFLRTVSHDLGAPLRNIMGMVDSIERRHGDGLPEQVRDRLARVRRNAQNEMALIGELLELSRIRTHRQSFEQTNVGDVVRDVADRLSADLEVKNVRLVTPDHWPVLRCERARLAQVFQNLMDNAVKYMGERDDAQIEVGWREEADRYVFLVGDNGMGVAPEDQQRIFHVFRRAKSAASQAEGKGVGLAAVKAIVETYDGEVWVESELGRGSTFYFSLAKARVSRNANEGPAGPTGRVAEKAEPGVEG